MMCRAGWKSGSRIDSVVGADRGEGNDGGSSLKWSPRRITHRVRAPECRQQFCRSRFTAKLLHIKKSTAANVTRNATDIGAMGRKAAKSSPQIISTPHDLSFVARESDVDPTLNSLFSASVCWIIIYSFPSVLMDSVAWTSPQNFDQNFTGHS
jgi:hypothetical protein